MTSAETLDDLDRIADDLRIERISKNGETQRRCNPETTTSQPLDRNLARAGVDWLIPIVT